MLSHPDPLYAECQVDEVHAYVDQVVLGDVVCRLVVGDGDAQQWVASADMLTGVRNKIDDGSGVAPGSLITSFQAVVTEGRSADVEGQSLAETAAGIYMIGREQY